jgi:hypothetical protein
MGNARANSTVPAENDIEASRSGTPCDLTRLLWSYRAYDEMIVDINEQAAVLAYAQRINCRLALNRTAAIAKS